MTAEVKIDTVLARFAETGRLDDYQKVAATTAVYPGAGEGQVLYPVIGLLDEAGEVAEKALLDFVSARPPEFSGRLPYWALTVAVTAGSILGQLKKTWRDGAGILDQDRLDALISFAARLKEQVAMLDKVVAEAKSGDWITLPRLPGPIDHDGLVKEAGDVLWYLARIVSERSRSLGEIAQENADKLARRREQNTLHGSGDDR